MWIEVDFGREQPVDQVRVELSEIEWEDACALETMDANGAWTPLARDHEELRQADTPGRCAGPPTYEAAPGGVDYFLIKDDRFGAKDYAEYQASWGLTRLEHASGASLYRVNQYEVNP